MTEGKQNQAYLNKTLVEFLKRLSEKQSLLYGQFRPKTKQV